MILIADRSKKIKAYLHNNIILLPGSMEVLGVILGGCVFGQDGKVKGKYFHKTFYSTTGEIVAIDNGSLTDRSADITTIMNESWRLITAITDHICPWVVPLENWSTQGVIEFLRG